jgi:two-component system, chemotaxis family, protein-glutamate methylesterase/glutaminase
MENKCPKISAVDVVVIGSSTGGPSLVEDIVLALPEDFPAAVLIVQHMPKYFTGNFAERLGKLAKVEVREAKNGDVLRVGTVLFAPGDMYTSVRRIKRDGCRNVEIALNERGKHHGPLDTIDTLMWSVAETYGVHAIGVILSGMGEDGQLGMEELSAKGGYLMVQNPDTAVVDSMPRAAIDIASVDEVLRPEKIAAHLVKLFCNVTA